MEKESEISGIEEIRDLLYKIVKFDINTFKKQFLKRRIIYAMNCVKIDTIDKYYNYLIENPNEVYKLIDTLAINVSSFFRNSNVFSFLREYLIIENWGRREKINIWSMGCASGEEPYSIAMIIDELGIDNVKIYASDIDDEALTRAKKGIYNKQQIKMVPERYLKYFEKLNEEEYQIIDRIKKCIAFKQENLLNRERYYRYYDIILCRNLLIFLDKEWQEKLFKLIDGMIMDNGILVLGISESIPRGYEGFWQAVSGKYRIYKKK